MTLFINFFSDVILYTIKFQRVLFVIKVGVRTNKRLKGDKTRIASNAPLYFDFTMDQLPSIRQRQLSVRDVDIYISFGGER